MLDAENPSGFRLLEAAPLDESVDLQSELGLVPRFASVL
jgi:hypothetical protein